MGEAVEGSSTFSTRAAARILAVSPDRIRYWVKRRLINPAASPGRKYPIAFKDLLVMRLAKDLLRERRHLEPLQRCLRRMIDLVDPGRSVTSLKLVNDEGRIVVSDCGVLIEAETGQLLFDFRSERPTGNRAYPGLPAAPPQDLIERPRSCSPWRPSSRSFSSLSWRFSRRRASSSRA